MSNPFDALRNDTISIKHKDGRTSGPFKVIFSNGDSFRVHEANLKVAEGDEIERPIPNGQTERYEIVDVHFSQGRAGMIPPSFKLQGRKLGSLAKKDNAKTHITITNSQAFQIGDNNTQTIMNSLHELVAMIDKSSGSDEEKKEAKSRLKTFLEHPLTSATLGGVATLVAGLLPKH